MNQAGITHGKKFLFLKYYLTLRLLLYFSNMKVSVVDVALTTVTKMKIKWKHKFPAYSWVAYDVTAAMLYLDERNWLAILLLVPK